MGGSGDAPANGGSIPAPPPTWPGPSGLDGAVLADVKGLLPSELAELLATWGQPAYRGRQLFEWLHGKGVRAFADITVLPDALREVLDARATLLPATLVTRQADPHDGTVKYLFRLGDGHTVETVLMRYRYGYTACVSSQVGCRQGCRFCASTIGGLKRNLLAGEMAEQIAFLNRDLALHGTDHVAFPVPAAERDAPPARPHAASDFEADDAPALDHPHPSDPAAPDGAPAAPTPRFDRIGRLVVMGMGEPMENLEAVVRFLRVVHAPSAAGIGFRHMTVSTSGLIPGIDRLAEMQLPITLAISLHAPNDELRDRLVPLNRRYPINDLLAACRRYVDSTGRRLTFEYVMISGVNDLPEHARELGRLLRGLPCHINLIPLNSVPEWNLHPSTPEAMSRFRGLVRGAGLPCTIRRQLGTSIDAACGQLRRRSEPS